MRRLFGPLFLAVVLMAWPVSALGADDRSADVELLPGVELAAELVEPRVWRVDSDGHRDLAWSLEPDVIFEYEPPGMQYLQMSRAGSVEASHGGVWLIRPDGIIRLGQRSSMFEGENPSFRHRLDVAPDGTLYRPHGGAYLVGESWKKPRLRRLGVRMDDGGRILFAPDGTLWARGTNGETNEQRRPRIARRDPDGWSLIKPPPTPPQRPHQRISQWWVTDDGALYVLQGQRLRRSDGQRWETVMGPNDWIGAPLVAPDGTVWAQAWREDGADLLRLDEDGWVAHELHERPWPFGTVGLVAGPDGAVWFAPGDPDNDTGGCDGIARYDGSRVTRFLPGRCVYDIDVSPNGTTWLQAGTWTGSIWDPDAVGPVETYVITPDPALSSR